MDGRPFDLSADVIVGGPPIPVSGTERELTGEQSARYFAGQVYDSVARSFVPARIFYEDGSVFEGDVKDNMLNGEGQTNMVQCRGHFGVNSWSGDCRVLQSLLNTTGNCIGQSLWNAQGTVGTMSSC